MALLKYDTTSALPIAKNPYQGLYKKVLFICSAGVLRSATAAAIFCQPPYNFNTRCAGVEHYALIPINDALLVWADEIVCMTQAHKSKLEAHINEVNHRLGIKAQIKCLNVPDEFPYRDADLIILLKQRYEQAG